MKKPSVFKLWEILVPVTLNGIQIEKKVHERWDAEVSEIAGGLTLLKPRKGKWLFNNQLCEEETIPVRIAATTAKIEAIAKYTARYYRQKAVMYYLVSEYARLYVPKS